MTWSLVKTLFSMQDVTSADAESSVVNPQRVWDESGLVQVELNQDPDPGAGADGSIVIEGRLHPDLAWAEVKEIPFSDFTASELTRIYADIDILPYMRAATRDTGSGYSVAGSTTADVFLQE